MNESEKELQRKFNLTLTPEGRGILLLDSSDTSIPETLAAGKKENTAENRNMMRHHILRAKDILKHINNVVIDEEFLLYNIEDQPASSWLLKRHLIPGFTLNWEEEIGISEFDKKESITDLKQKLKVLTEKYKIKFIRLVVSIDFSEPSKDIPKTVTDKIEKCIAIGKLIQDLEIIPYFSLKIGKVPDTMVSRKQHLFWHKALAYFTKKLQDSEIVLEAIGLGMDLVNAAALQKALSSSITTIQRDAIKNYATIIRTIPIAIPLIAFETNNEVYEVKAYRTFCLFVNTIFKSDLEFPFKATYCLGEMLYGTALQNLKSKLSFCPLLKTHSVSLIEDISLYYFAYEQMFLKRAEDIEESLKGAFKETDEAPVLGENSISIVSVGSI